MTKSQSFCALCVSKYRISLLTRQNNITGELCFFSLRKWICLFVCFVVAVNAYKAFHLDTRDYRWYLIIHQQLQLVGLTLYLILIKVSLTETISVMRSQMNLWKRVAATSLRQSAWDHYIEWLLWGSFQAHCNRPASNHRVAGQNKCRVTFQDDPG